MKYTIIGCGVWGRTIAQHLAALPDARIALLDPNRENLKLAEQACGDSVVATSWDVEGYLAVTGTSSSTGVGGSVVIATPPETRLKLVQQVLDGYGVPPVRLRLEKPLASSVFEAESIVNLCESRTRLTCGFTLLHHPLYEHAFSYLNKYGYRVLKVEGVRIGRAGRHASHPTLDLGVHAAAIGAYYNAPASITSRYDDTAPTQRKTWIWTTHGCVIVNEIDQTVYTPHGMLVYRPEGDAVVNELDAWLRGTHRGTPRVALETQYIIQDHLRKEVAV